MAEHILFKGIKRVLASNTAYTQTDSYLYFVRPSAQATEGDIWFMGHHYGHFGQHDLDAINTALAGFLDNQDEQGYKNVKQYIDDLIGGKDASVTGTSSDGHVTVQIDEADGALTAATVTTVDIASASATTQELNTIEEAVGLDADGSHKQSTGTYTSAATTIEGEIVALDTKLKEVADQVSDLDYNLASGDSAVLVSLNQTDGKVSAATENIANLKITGYQEGSDVDVAATDTLGQALGKLQGQINAMDLAQVHEAGKPIVAIAEEDGKVSATAGTIAAEYVTVADAQGLLTGATVEAALEELALKSSAITINNADGSINVTPSATGTDINVNIKSGEKVLAKDGAAGLYTDIKLSGVTPSSTTVKEEYALIGTDGSVLGDHIKVYKDSHIVSITYITDSASTHYQNLEYKYIDVNGNEQTEYVDISSLVLEAEFASGVGITNHIAHGVVDPASEKDSNNDSFLTVGADGFKVDGIKDEIVAKIAALDKTDDAAVAGQYVAAIEETDGVVAVKARANVSEAVLNNYTKGTDATAVAATDTVNQAISKLENQVDAAKAAATTKVAEGTDEGNNMTIASATSATDGSVTYTINLTDVASKAALDAEIAARKAVDGQNGDTYAANTGATYISGASSLNDADVKLDTAIKALSDQVSGLDYTGLTNENTKVVTDVKENDGLVSADATAVGDLVITAITTADTKVAANDNLATIAGKLQGQINAMDLPEVHESGAAIVSVSEADGKVSAATGDVNTDHVVLASAITGTTVTGMTSGKKESEVLQAIVDAIANLGGNALTGVTSTGNTLHVDPVSGNVQNVEFLKESATDTTVADGHLELAKNGNNEWYGVMYWIDEETNQG